MKNKSKEIIAISVGIIIIIVIIVVLVLTRLSSNDTFEDVVDNPSVSNSENQPSNQFAIDEEVFVKRAYDLKFVYSIDSFENASDISANKIVQYSICHLYYESVMDIPNTEDVQYREVSVKDVLAIAKIHFNIDDIDYENTDLYNKSAKQFEMWLPSGNNQVSYNYSTTENNGEYTINATYYSDTLKSEVLGSAVITVVKDGDNYYIKSMR